MGEPEARLHDDALDGERHRPERHLRQPRLSVQQEVQPLRRRARQPGNALAAGLAPLLARQRPRHGGRVLPPLLRHRRLRHRRGRCRASGTRRRSPTATAPSASPPPSSTASSPAAARCGGCRRRRSSGRAAATATGSSTRSSPPASASRAPSARSRASAPRRESNPENTTLRLADSVNLFETGALAPGVTIDTADFPSSPLDAGMKYRGLLPAGASTSRAGSTSFVADGPLPVREIDDTGFYVQASFYPIPQEARGLRRDVAGLRRQGRRLPRQLRVPRRRQLVPLRQPQLPPQPPAHGGQPLAGEQRLRLLHRRPGRVHGGDGSVRSSSERSMTTQRARWSRRRAASAPRPLLLICLAGSHGRRGRTVAPRSRSLRRQRLPLPPHQLRPGRHRHPRLPEDHGRQGRPRRRCSASRCSRPGRIATPATSRPPTTCRPTRRSTTTPSPTPTSPWPTARSPRSSRRASTR